MTIDNHRNGSGLRLLVSGLACLALAGWMCLDLVVPKADGALSVAVDSALPVTSSAEPRYATKKIEDIQPGDRVVARDDVTGDVRRHDVVQLFRKWSDHLRMLTFQNADGTQQTIETTNEHPFWVSNVGWVTAQNLQPGDSVDTANSQSVVLTAENHCKRPTGIGSARWGWCSNAGGRPPKTQTD